MCINTYVTLFLKAYVTMRNRLIRMGITMVIVFFRTIDPLIGELMVDEVSLFMICTIQHSPQHEYCSYENQRNTWIYKSHR